MDTAEREHFFAWMIEARAQVRARCCLPGPAASWHVAKANKVLAESVAERSHRVDPAVEKEEWSAYIARLPGVIFAIEWQNKICADSWCADDGDRAQFQTERSKLLQLFEQVRLCDREYERLARQEKKPLLAEAQSLISGGRDDSDEAGDLEGYLRMTV